jgi:DNA polymerase
MLKEHQQEVVFALLSHADADLFEMLYERPIDTISQCMRGFLKAPEGYRFVVVDYKAIEARVLAWVANDKKMLADYRAGLDLYRLLAANLFNVKPEDVTQEQRRIGKNLILGCGYGLGGKNFVGYCAKEGLYIDEKFAIKAVKKYRARAEAIVQSWYKVEEAAVNAVEHPGRSFHACKATYKMEGRWLTCELPSGRKLYYRDPKVEQTTKFDKPYRQLSFKSEYKGKWIRERTWGGTLIENIVQAIACDIMVEGMFSAEEHDYPVVGTVHDELLTLVEDGQGSHEELALIACEGQPWMKGIPLESEGAECIRYRKL